MPRPLTAVELAVALGIGASVLAVAVPAFFRNLSASKLSEPVEGLDRIVTSALAYAAAKPQELSFPPSAPLTPAQVPKGVRATDSADAWEHLTWRSLGYRMTEPHAFAFEFDSARDPETQTMVFRATAHGDLDGDGAVSTFEVRGERAPGHAPRVLPGMFVDREVE
jgi:hypothetical protein